MKIKDGYKLCKVRDNSIVIAVGDAVMDFNGLVTLNETGEFIWQKLENDMTEDEIISAMTSEYDIDRETAKADFDEFIEKLKGANFIEQ